MWAGLLMALSLSQMFGQVHSTRHLDLVHGAAGTVAKGAVAVGNAKPVAAALSVNQRAKYAVGRCPSFSSHLWAHEDNGYVHQFKHFTGWSSTGSTYGQEQGDLNPADANGDGVDDNAPDDAILSEFAYRTVRARFVGLKASGNIRLLQGR